MHENSAPKHLSVPLWPLKILLAPQSAAANLQRKAGNSAPPFRFCCIKLFPDAQGCNDRPVTLDVNFLKVVEQTATLTDHLQQTATGMVILLVSLVWAEQSEPRENRCRLREGHTLQWFRFWVPFPFETSVIQNVPNDRQLSIPVCCVTRRSFAKRSGQIAAENAKFILNMQFSEHSNLF